MRFAIVVSAVRRQPCAWSLLLEEPAADIVARGFKGHKRKLPHFTFWDDHIPAASCPLLVTFGKLLENLAMAATRHTSRYR